MHFLAVFFLCIFFRNFSQLQDIHSWLNSDFHFSNIYVFLSTNGWYLFTSLFLDRNTHPTRKCSQEFPQRKVHTTSSEHWKSGGFPKTNSRNSSPNPALLPVPEKQSELDVFCCREFDVLLGWLRFFDVRQILPLNISQVVKGGSMGKGGDGSSWDGRKGGGIRNNGGISLDLFVFPTG